MNSWLDELLCDTIALGYMGPSFLLAATAFLFVSAKNDASPSHPSPSIRVRWALDCLDRLGWLDVLRRQFPKTVEWIEWLGQVPASGPADHVGTFVLGALRELQGPAFDVVSAFLGRSVFRPEEYLEVEGQLLELLKYRIPPVQLEDGTAAGRRQVMLACWLSQLDRHGDSAEGIASALDDVEMQRFFAKAIEMSYVLEQWSKV